MTNQERENLLAKLRLPIHIDYISKYILKVPISETKIELEKLISEDIISESKYAKDYYVIKTKDED